LGKLCFEFNVREQIETRMLSLDKVVMVVVDVQEKLIFLTSGKRKK